MCKCKDSLSIFSLLLLFHSTNKINQSIKLYSSNNKPSVEITLKLLSSDTGGPKGWARLNKTLTRHKSVLVAFKQKTATQRNAQEISNVSMTPRNVYPCNLYIINANDFFALCDTQDTQFIYHGVHTVRSMTISANLETSNFTVTVLIVIICEFLFAALTNFFISIIWPLSQSTKCTLVMSQKIFPIMSDHLPISLTTY